MRGDMKSGKKPCQYLSVLAAVKARSDETAILQGEMVSTAPQPLLYRAHGINFETASNNRPAAEKALVALVSSCPHALMSSCPQLVLVIAVI